MPLRCQLAMSAQVGTMFSRPIFKATASGGRTRAEACRIIMELEQHWLHATDQTGEEMRMWKRWGGGLFGSNPSTWAKLHTHSLLAVPNPRVRSA